MKTTMKYCTRTTLFLFVLLTSCTTMDTGQTGSGSDGAPPVQPTGHQIEAMLVKTAAGPKLIDIVANRMDTYDRQMLNHVYERGISGQTTSWVNPDRGNQFQVIPQPAYAGRENRSCRKAEITAIIPDKTEKAYTTACRDANGRWQIQQ
jgi:surface antigen